MEGYPTLWCFRVLGAELELCGVTVTTKTSPNGTFTELQRWVLFWMCIAGGEVDRGECALAPKACYS